MRPSVVPPIFPKPLTLTLWKRLIQNGEEPVHLRSDRVKRWSRRLMLRLRWRRRSIILILPSAPIIIPGRRVFMDMASLTATINIPIFYKTKQEPAVLEANANLLGAKRELVSTEYMLSSAIRENHSMVQTGTKLLSLYKEGITPKIRQDFQLALSGYATGKIEAITAISRLKALLDTELLYWGQYVEREKAIARLEALTGDASSELSVRSSEKNKDIKDPANADRRSGGTSQ